MRRLASLAVVFALAMTVSGRAQDRRAGPSGPADKPIRLTYLFSDGNLPGTLKAFKALLQERPDLRGKVQLAFVTESVLSDVRPDELKATDVLLLDTMNQQLLERVNANNKIDLIGTCAIAAARWSRSAKGCCQRRPTSSRAPSGMIVRAPTGRTWGTRIRSA